MKSTEKSWEEFLEFINKGINFIKKYLLLSIYLFDQSVINNFIVFHYIERKLHFLF